MSDYPGFNRVFLFAAGVYLFTSMIQAGTSQAHVSGALERAIHSLAHLDLHGLPDDGSGRDPAYTYLQAFEP